MLDDFLLLDQCLKCLETLIEFEGVECIESDQDVHDLFRNQQELDAFVQSQLIEQNATEERVETATECRSWNLLLDSSNMNNFPLLLKIYKKYLKVMCQLS